TRILASSENGVWVMFIILACVYAVMMFCGHLILAKPADWHEPAAGEKKPGIMETLKTKPLTNYIGIWLMFYINITCGLAIISQEKAIVKCLGLVAYAGLISSISSLFNAGGRLGFSAWADFQKDRNTIYKIIFSLSIIFTALVIVTNGIKGGEGKAVLIALVLILIFVVNAGYGGGFSNVPTLLSDHYGMGSISAIHGITLSAWAFAGLSGNQLATYIVNHTGEFITKNINGVDVKLNPAGYQNVLYVTGALYILALVLCMVLVKPSNTKGEKK
ncbi:MAG: MFS transporter, partial [Lachnospiraceae bacterium]|nr:MFS transporter [Lachnospiraceae bacterium]